MNINTLLLLLCFILLIIILINLTKQKNISDTKGNHKKYYRNRSYYRKRSYSKIKKKDANIIGKNGETKIINLLNNQSIPGYYKILRNIYLMGDGENRSEIDILLIHETGFYIIESKNVSGNIYGSSYDKSWTVKFYRSQNTYPIANPIHQNYGHIMFLKNMLHLTNDSYFKSFVVFSNHCKLSKINLCDNDKTIVIQQNQLVDTLIKEISNATYKPFSKDKIDSYEYILSAFCNKSQDIKEKHIERLKQKN